MKGLSSNFFKYVLKIADNSTSALSMQDHTPIVKLLTSEATTPHNATPYLARRSFPYTVGQQRTGRQQCTPCHRKHLISHTLYSGSSGKISLRSSSHADVSYLPCRAHLLQFRVNCINGVEKGLREETEDKMCHRNGTNACYFLLRYRRFLFALVPATQPRAIRFLQ